MNQRCQLYADKEPVSYNYSDPNIPTSDKDEDLNTTTSTLQTTQNSTEEGSQRAWQQEVDRQVLTNGTMNPTYSALHMSVGTMSQESTIDQMHRVGQEFRNDLNDQIEELNHQHEEAQQKLLLLMKQQFMSNNKLDTQVRKCLMYE